MYTVFEKVARPFWPCILGFYPGFRLYHGTDKDPYETGPPCIATYIHVLEEQVSLLFPLVPGQVVAGYYVLRICRFVATELLQ